MLYISISIVLYSALTVLAVVDGVVLLILVTVRHHFGHASLCSLLEESFIERCAWVFWNVWLRKWELLRNYLRMDFINTFYNTDKLRNWIITNVMNKILENVSRRFWTNAPLVHHLRKYSVEVAKSSFLNVRMYVNCATTVFEYCSRVFLPWCSYLFRHITSSRCILGRVCRMLFRMWRYVIVENVRDGWMKYPLQALFGYRFPKGWC